MSNPNPLLADDAPLEVIDAREILAGPGAAPARDRAPPPARQRARAARVHDPAPAAEGHDRSAHAHALGRRGDDLGGALSAAGDARLQRLRDEPLPDPRRPAAAQPRAGDGRPVPRRRRAVLGLVGRRGRIARRRRDVVGAGTGGEAVPVLDRDVRAQQPAPPHGRPAAVGHDGDPRARRGLAGRA